MPRGKARCKLGLECPFQHEHQHTAEFSHSAEPARKRKSSTAGSTSFRGRGKKVGRITPSAPKPRRPRQPPSSRANGIKGVNATNAGEENRRDSPRSAAAKAALQRAERLRQAKLLQRAAEERSRSASNSARMQRRDRRAQKNGDAGRNAHLHAAPTKQGEGSAATTEEDPRASAGRQPRANTCSRTRVVSDASDLIDLSDSPKVKVASAQASRVALADQAIVVDLSHAM